MVHFYGHFIVNNIIKLINRLPFSKDIILSLIEWTHMGLFLLYFYIIFKTRKERVLWILLAVSMFVLGSQIYFGGCLVSLVEKKLRNGTPDLFHYFFQFQRNLIGFTDSDVKCSMKWASAGIIIIIYKLYYLSR
jgi:hypothetical protein